MTRETSRRCYEELKQSNYLTKKQREVMEAIVIWGPITQSQLDNKIPHAHKRVAELEQMDLIKAIGTIKDPLTHKQVCQYIATGNNPKPLKSKAKSKIKDGNMGIDIVEYTLLMSRHHANGYRQGYYDAINGVKFPDTEVEL